MGLAIATTSFECTIEGGLAHVVLNQPDRGNPIDGDFCREFGLCMAELSERDDVRSLLISARGRLFSVGGDLAALASRGAALPVTIKSWTADLHAAIVRMVRMRAPVVVAVQGNVAGGSVSLMAAGDLVVIGKSARISSAFARIGFTPDSGSTTTVTRRIGVARARRFFLLAETMDADAARQEETLGNRKHAAACRCCVVRRFASHAALSMALPHDAFMALAPNRASSRSPRSRDSIMTGV